MPDQAAPSIETRTLSPSQANLRLFEPGKSGNPKGRPARGASVAEWRKILTAQDLTAAALRQIASDPTESVTKRFAARELVASLELGDMSDLIAMLATGGGIEEAHRRGVDVRQSVQRTQKRDGGGQEVITRVLKLEDAGLGSIEIKITRRRPAENELAGKQE